MGIVYLMGNGSDSATNTNGSNLSMCVCVYITKNLVRWRGSVHVKCLYFGFVKNRRNEIKRNICNSLLESVSLFLSLSHPPFVPSSFLRWCARYGIIGRFFRRSRTFVMFIDVLVMVFHSVLGQIISV